jgi:WD40 repeat protein
MPFLVTCECGKKLRVADENEGKKVRCPACQALVVARPEPAAKAAPKAPREEEEPEVKRRPAPREDEDNGEAPPKRSRRDEEENDEERPAKKPARKAERDDDEDEAPARSKRKQASRDDDEDDRPVKKAKKKGARTWLWVGCGCSSLLFLGCAGIIALAAIFGGKDTPEARLAGSWELDRASGAPIPDQFVKYKTFGFDFDKDGTFREDWDGSVHEGKWRADKGFDDDPVYAYITYQPNTRETILRFRPQENKDRLIFNHAGAMVPLKRTDRRIAASKGDAQQPGGNDKGSRDGDGKPKSVAFYKEHTKDVVSLAFWGDDLLASASWDGTVKVWQLPGDKSKYTFKGHTGQARSVAFLGSGSTLASAGGNPDPSAKGGEVKVWDLVNGAEKATPYKGDRTVETVAANRTGRLMAWSSFADVVVWDVNGNKQAATLPGHSWEVAAVAIPETGRLVAVAGGQELKLWDLPTIGTKPGKPASAPTAARFTLKAPSLLHSVAFSLDGSMVAAGGDGAVTVWEVASGAQKWTAKTPDGGDAKGVAFSRDGKQLVAACGAVQFWDAANGDDLGKWEADFSEGHYPYSVAISADGKKLATGALNGSIKVWDFSTPPAAKR